MSSTDAAAAPAHDDAATDNKTAAPKIAKKRSKAAPDSATKRVQLQVARLRAKALKLDGEASRLEAELIGGAEAAA